MAAGPNTIAVPPSVFRGLRNRSWLLGSAVAPQAFLLRKDEAGLTFGLTAAASVQYLTVNFGAAELRGPAIVALPHQLSFSPHPALPAECTELVGPPPFATDPNGRERMLTVANDLAMLVVSVIP